MAFKIRAQEFENGEQFVEVIPGSYGICVCLKVLSNDTYQLIKYQNLSKSSIAKTLADYLVTDNRSLSCISIGDEIYKIPEGRTFKEIKTTLQVVLERLDD